MLLAPVFACFIHSVLDWVGFVGPFVNRVNKIDQRKWHPPRFYSIYPSGLLGKQVLAEEYAALISENREKR